MSAYTQPIFVAVIVFGFIAFAIFIPWLIYTYRKYGFLSFSKTLIAFSFIFYFLAALFLVLLPLPETTNTCAQQRPDTQFYNLRLFQFIPDILRNSGISLSNPATWIYTIKQPSFYQAFFNFLLLMPFGVYLRYFLKEHKFWKHAFFIGLALTLFYEITQVTGIYGIYNCPYRIFDVDDLMLNSLGSLIGFFIAPIILAMFPKHEEVVARGEMMQARNIVRPIHRFLALVIDLALVELLTTAVFFVLKENILLDFGVKSILYIVLLLIVPLMMNGATVGMRLLKIRMVDKETGLFTRRGIVRLFMAFYVVELLFAVLVVANNIELNFDSPFYAFQIIVVLVTFFISVAIGLVLVIHVLLVLFSKGKRAFFFDAVANVEATRK